MACIAGASLYPKEKMKVLATFGVGPDFSLFVAWLLCLPLSPNTSCSENIVPVHRLPRESVDGVTLGTLLAVYI